MSLGGSITKSAIAEDHIAAYQIEKLRQIPRHFAGVVNRAVLSRSSG
jgi:hypothetical protein